jgi:hypothetical protein
MTTKRNIPIGLIECEPSTSYTDRVKKFTMTSNKNESLLPIAHTVVPNNQSTDATKRPVFPRHNLPSEPLNRNDAENVEHLPSDSPKPFAFGKPTTAHTIIVSVPAMSTKDLLLLKHCVEGQLKKRRVGMSQNTGDELDEWCYVDQSQDTLASEDTFEVVKIEDAEY